MSAHRFWVVQCGRDEIVEVDRLDVEGLAHVGAAVAQDLHDFGPILHQVEMRLNRLRLRRHLAQRQRSRENLDEDGFHLGNVGRARALNTAWTAGSIAAAGRPDRSSPARNGAGRKRVGCNTAPTAGRIAA